ncbi:hypothetical protein SAMN05216167_103436 [Spirosoma endophyticum]|uniref:Uncharacterized protein n=1 Tax=Spirosoma endophyticum TaxID=662367 RepID=A0A1I1PU63_9BACT|nr:hypothetical protein SAMN05216167_103436 [Spirosoma endophyticum]
MSAGNLLLLIKEKCEVEGYHVKVFAETNSKEGVKGTGLVADSWLAT